MLEKSSLFKEALAEFDIPDNFVVTVDPVRKLHLQSRSRTNIDSGHMVVPTKMRLLPDTCR